MQDKQEDENDDLVDYNEDPELGGVPGSSQPTSHTPVQTPQSLVSEDEDENEDRNNLEEGQDQEPQGERKRRCQDACLRRG